MAGSISEVKLGLDIINKYAYNDKSLFKAPGNKKGIYVNPTDKMVSQDVAQLRSFGWYQKDHVTEEIIEQYDFSNSWFYDI